MKITILTRSPNSLIEPAWAVINNLLFPGIYRRGPFAVQNSLLKGLDMLSIDYSFNPSKKEISETVCVLAGVGPLKWAIREKQKGNIKKIIAGPNIVAAPDEANGIILNDLIDIVVTPSEWVKDFFSTYKNGFDKKIKIWAAGVDTDFFKPKKSKLEKGNDFLIYFKTNNYNLLNNIKQELANQNLSYTVLNYGKYGVGEYFDLLENSKYMIYLSESETQGIALQEAWACDIPTLVWDKGFWSYKRYFWKGLTNAPYMKDICGIRFKEESEFASKLLNFLELKPEYKPRDYVLNNFSLKKSAQNYLAIIEVTG